MTSVSGSQPSWSQARYDLTHENGNKKFDTVADSLVPGIKKDSDGIVKIEFGTCFWDYAEAVKELSDDEHIKNMDTSELICKINEAQDNPFNDVDKIKAGKYLDLSKFIETPDEKAEKDCDKPDKPTHPKKPPKGQRPNVTYVNYYETNNNFFFFNGIQQPQQQVPCQQPAIDYTEINYTNNTFVAI